MNMVRNSTHFCVSVNKVNGDASYYRRCCGIRLWSHLGMRRFCLCSECRGVDSEGLLCYWSLVGALVTLCIHTRWIFRRLYASCPTTHNTRLDFSSRLFPRAKLTEQRSDPWFHKLNRHSTVNLWIYDVVKIWFFSVIPYAGITEEILKEQHK